MALNSVGRKETMQDTEMNRDEEIRQVAYKFWQEEGCPDGYDVQHWLEEKRPKNKPKQSKSLKARKVRQTPHR
jgi:hypothetical protein